MLFGRRIFSAVFLYLFYLFDLFQEPYGRFLDHIGLGFVVELHLYVFLDGL